MNCAACGKPGIAAISTPDGGFLCVRCVKSGKVVPGRQGEAARIEIKKEMKFWRRLVIMVSPEQMGGDELIKLANVLSDTLMLVESEIAKREKEEESDAAKTEDVSSAAALDAPEEKEERSGPVLFNPSVAEDQESDSQA